MRQEEEGEEEETNVRSLDSAWDVLHFLNASKNIRLIVGIIFHCVWQLGCER